jgi:hypothetical protein
MRLTLLLSRAVFTASLLGVLWAPNSSVVAAEPQWEAGEAVAVSITGGAEVTDDGKVWRVLRVNDVLKPGAQVRTMANSKVDLFLNHNGPAVVVEASSQLALTTLKRLQTGDEIDTETQLDVKAGSIVGYTQKMSPRSRYVVKHGLGEAVITGTIYQVYASGYVYVQSGSVDVRYSQSGLGNLGNVVNVAAGFYFNPANYAATLTPPSMSDTIIATVNTSVGNIRNFNLSRGRKLRVTAVEPVSI